ncbi:hypothetical protein BBF96_01470 [Anoxybacter fermentans]|uniref:HTH marR-type domain-containing protein n=1 Tax=Anoxybacter fermentans TaxID=1323375 RepID=A0A3Q9HNS8_9FIRM|nr:ROK family transcriptional regulator [Anoxybacter fermentans]AZR72180.1 hypothetical protein BBF96_01470 [Anoxybacter fermentans]
MQDITVGNSQVIRDWNLGGIFKLIHKLGPISRKELAESTGYSAATVSNHVKTLIKEGFVIETEKGNSTGGRKPVYLTVNPNKGYIFSIDIEVNKVKIVMFNLKLNLVMKSIIPILDKSNSDKVFDQIFVEIDKMMEEKKLKSDDILGMGIAVPGLIDKDNGILEFAPNLGWRKINILKILGL